MATYSFLYAGEVVSLNKLYASNSWKIRSVLKNRFHQIFSVYFLAAKVKKMKKYELHMFVNSRHDIDNLAAMAKFAVDSLRKGGYVVDDTTKYYRGLHIVVDKSLRKGTIKFLITDEVNEEEEDDDDPAES